MATGSVVRSTVRELLASSAAYAALPPDKRRRIASDMVRVASYMADPGGLVAKEVGEPLLSEATRRSRARTMTRRPASAFKDGTDVAIELVASVDFPEFVAALINGTFQAIVSVTIEQMEAYAKLLAGVAKAVDAFAQEGITDSSAGDHLAQRFPDVLACGTEGRRLRWCGAPAQCAVTVQRGLSLPRPETDVRRLVAATRRRLAIQLQQMLSTMVLMGINRIVVKDGSISAKARGAMRAASG